MAGKGTGGPEVHIEIDEVRGADVVDGEAAKGVDRVDRVFERVALGHITIQFRVLCHEMGGTRTQWGLYTQLSFGESGLRSSTR